MYRRTFLASTAGLVLAPYGQIEGAFQGGGAAHSPLGETAFDGWLQRFRARAAAQGYSEGLLDSALGGLASDPRVLALDGRQPEFSKPISDYIASTVSDARVARGRAKLDSLRPMLHAAEDSSGVPVEMMAAIWGVESDYGAVQGDLDVIRSLATLAAQGRRSAWAEGQLLSALRMLSRGDVSRDRLRGSWAGAMGQTQFTPEDYLSFAVDGNGDGRRDIWGSSVDALASTANFLAKKAAWRAEQSWAREMVVPVQGFDYALVEGPALSTAQWRAQGVRPADGRGFAPQDAEDAVATLIMPMGWRGPGFLAFPNHMAIRAYNNSTSYALAVGLLADRLGGRAPMVQAWPYEAPTSLADRMAAQEALARLGFDPGTPDGVIGAGTRKAVRAWQASKGLPAEGYLSGELLARLKAQGVL